MARVLVVDDSRTIRTFTASVLENAGYEVRTAENTWIAGIVNAFRPDLILMDVELGVATNGATAVSILKRTAQKIRPMLVLYSSLDEETLRRLATESGADGFFHKDGDPDVLVRKVNAFLSSKAAVVP